MNVDGGVAKEFQEEEFEGEELKGGGERSTSIEAVLLTCTCLDAEEFETAAFAAMKKAVSKGGKIKVVMPAEERGRGRKREGAGGHGRKDVDLRDLINKSREERDQERKG